MWNCRELSGDALRVIVFIAEGEWGKDPFNRERLASRLGWSWEHCNEVLGELEDFIEPIDWQEAPLILNHDGQRRIIEMARMALK